MKSTLALLLIVFSLPTMALEEGFTALFNGKDFSGWTKVGGTGEFKTEGEEIVGFGKNVKGNTFLRSDKTYKNFDFRFEMKFDDLTGNSGMMFRALRKPGKNGQVYGYQCEHCNRKDRSWSAGLFDEKRRGWLFPDKKKPEECAAFTKQGSDTFKWDDWNEIRILAKGKRIQIWLNGEQRVDFTDEGDDFTPEGFFGLQVHGGKSCHVRWRNLRVREL
ncbi:3-keto-disaccharide hydrolase [Haloferula sp.]|uniref:3-keto-disaccharide hydrolase n=1 Tax=Haloferula sp. TaxID=2497595 RepID=UPI00329A9977